MASYYIQGINIQSCHVRAKWTSMIRSRNEFGSASTAKSRSTILLFYIHLRWIEPISKVSFFYFRDGSDIWLFPKFQKLKTLTFFLIFYKISKNLNKTTIVGYILSNDIHSISKNILSKTSFIQIRFYEQIGNRNHKQLFPGYLNNLSIKNNLRKPVCWYAAL